MGRESVVCIAMRIGMNGTGIESRFWLDFPHPFIPGLRPTKAPTQWMCQAAVAWR